jgi:AbiU2
MKGWSKAALDVKEIAAWHFLEAIEIGALIEILEASNTPEVVRGIQSSNASHVRPVLVRSLFGSVLLKVVRAYAPNPRPGDRHLRVAFDLLKDSAVRDEVAARGDAAALTAAAQRWNACCGDHRLKTLQHIRDKDLAHLGEKTKANPLIRDLFGFARTTAGVVESLAKGTGAVTLDLQSQTDVWRERAKEFWEPWAKQQAR